MNSVFIVQKSVFFFMGFSLNASNNVHGIHKLKIYFYVLFNNIKYISNIPRVIFKKKKAFTRLEKGENNNCLNGTKEVFKELNVLMVNR